MPGRSQPHPSTQQAPAAWRSWDARRGEPGPWHVRHDRQDGSKVVTWQLDDGTAGLGGHDLADLVFLTELARDTIRRYWTPGALVVAEGEKAASAIAAAQLPGIGTVCGASATPGPSVVALLSGWPVVLWPDADVVGRQHMDRLGLALEAAGVPALSIVRWPGDYELLIGASVPEHGDAADATPRRIRELVAEALLRPIGPVAA